MRRRTDPPSHVAHVADPDAGACAELARLVHRIGCDVVESRTGAELLDRTMGPVPSVVVLDLALADVSAYECCRVLRERFGEVLPIALVSEHRREPADEVAALLLGADDYIGKPLNGDVFCARIRRMLARTHTGPPPPSPLTPRESEVLSLMVDGVAAPEISARLCITNKTTATHIEHILAKIGAHSRAQAVAFAVRDHLVPRAPASA
jgi:DNA-binding NarL/FixJ family response regulator